MKQHTEKSGVDQVSNVVQVGSPAALLRQALRERIRMSMVKRVDDLFRQEVSALCGERYRHNQASGSKRSGSEAGSIYWNGTRRAVRRPRVRDESGEVSLEAYRALRDYDLLSDEVLALVIRGVSTRDYSAVTEKLEGDLALSKSSVSRAFQHASRKDLDTLNGRDLSREQYGALMLDGVKLRDDVTVMVALGFTVAGEKRILGLRDEASENATVVKDLLQNLVDRGLACTDEILVVLDGAKALTSAIRSHFGQRAQIQRCQEHKIRNVKQYLPDTHHAEADRRLRAAYGMKTHAQASQALHRARAWLAGVSDSAATSLDEGMEETVTVHRLELPELLRRTFRSTNPIESLFDKVQYRKNRVKRWRKPEQCLRWLAASFTLHEKRFNRIRGWQQMPLLVAALSNRKLDTATSAA